METIRPDYIKIFNDMITEYCPERKAEFEIHLNKESLSIIDIIKLNNKIFGLNDKETIEFNQKHKSYNKATILHILNYQKENALNNVQLANHFNLSRNTVSKWKKIFLNK